MAIIWYFWCFLIQSNCFVGEQLLFNWFRLHISWVVAVVFVFLSLLFVVVVLVSSSIILCAGVFSLPICRNDCLSRRWWLSTRCWWFNQSHLLFDFLQCVWLGTGKTPKIWLFGDLERRANVQNKNHYKCTHFKWCD